MSKKPVMLIVDDVEANREVMASSFSNDFEIMSAVNGKEAIRQIQKHGKIISIILLDIIMPEMDGIAVLKWLSDSEYRFIPVLAVTTDKSYQLEALRLGAADFIPKPTEIEIIKARVNNAYARYSLMKEKNISKELAESKNKMQRLQRQSENLAQEYETLVNTVPGGIALYSVIDGKIKTKFYSDGLCKLSGFSRDEREKICKDDAMALTYSEDIPLLQKTIRRAIEDQTDFNLVYRIKNKNGSSKYVQLNATYVHNKNKFPEFYAVFSDIDRIKKLEEITHDQQLRYEVTVKSAGINIWEYDIQNDSLTVISNSPRIKQNCFTIDDYVKSTVEHDYVRADSLDDFYRLYDRLKKGEKEVTADIWYKTTSEAGWWCERVIYTSVFDDNGIPLKAFGAGRDVTEEKNAIRKFQEEMSYRAAIQDGSLGSLKINLTQNFIINGDSPFKAITTLIDNQNADFYFEKTSEKIIRDSDREQFHKMFTRRSLIDSYSKGDHSLSLQCTRMFDSSKIYWINYTVHLMKNPESNDIIALVVTHDITDEMVMKTIMKTVANTDYDFFVVVDGSVNSAVDFETKDNRRLFYEEQPYESRNEELIRSCVCAEDVERVVENCRIENVIKKTIDGSTYKFNFSMHEKDGSIRRKQLQLTLIDRNRKTFLMTRVDVNDLFIEQQKNQQKIEEALKAAQNAAAAKSDFLSRMSHDIRTPLNAVIGLSELGSDNNSVDEIHDYMRQITSSGQYLLSIINDVLDMSKITSNTFVLKSSVVYLPKFIQDTIAIVRPTITAKKIEFELKQNSIRSEYMRFDKTHVQQVVINLLSNAIKFTPENGHIVLTLENISRSGNMVRNRMIVSDNGIGISKEFLPKLFLPFEQENTLNDETRVGTGLGLAIVKSIIDLMGGKTV